MSRTSLNTWAFVVASLEFPSLTHVAWGLECMKVLNV